MPKLWRDIIDDVGKGELRVVGANALLRSQLEPNPVADALSRYRPVQTADELGPAAVDISSRADRIAPTRYRIGRKCCR